jgi:hypothetical protein
MQRIRLDLNSIRAARVLRAGVNQEVVSNEFGISLRNIEKIQSVYGSVSDSLLVGIERVLSDREKLRQLISNLLHRTELLP